MREPLHPDELRAKKICHGCVGDDYLSCEIRKDRRRRGCSYCGSRRVSMLIDDLAERVAIAFRDHYARTPSEPEPWQARASADPDFDYEWERDGEPVIWAIADAVQISEEVAKDVQIVLAEVHGDIEDAKAGLETEFHWDSHYEAKDPSDDVWTGHWAAITRSLKTEARFFNQMAKERLQSAFRGLATRKASSGRPLMVEAGPCTSLETVYRARTFQSHNKLLEALRRPDRDLGPPPSNLAKAGRMNAQGVAVFYGATDSSVALAEVRPPVGSNVAVARFVIVRSLRLFDFTALEGLQERGSIFDQDFARRLELETFLRSFGERIARPVMPDEEASEYVPTQVVAEFMATENEPPFDGVIFGSAQTDGTGANVVLFHKAARVAEINLPAGTKVIASQDSMYEDGSEEEYTVVEEVPGPEPSREGEPAPTPSSAGSSLDEYRERPGSDPREVALRVDLESVCIHQIEQACFRTSVQRVSRYRWEDTPDAPF